ncbi:MAG: gliding motility-associated C-terminal domain-containing protein, partial [Flavobacteriales bacterium]|nr:gliding motility-associated C-terminal domain-containing protein [Flavobacteriales bacterium]
MYKPLYILFFLLIIGTTSSNAQNLVFNGDFELFDTCPVNPSTTGDLQIEHCTGWTAPTKLGTSDYFNVCNNSTTFQLAGVPQNLLGYQQPLNGNGYCGFFAWVINNANGIDFSYREYVQTKLIQPLIAGNEYHFVFHVSYNGFNYSVEKIGALFSSNDFNANTFSPIVVTPQVVNTNGIITDSLGWTKIEGDFIATGGELFLTIGYFEDSLTITDTLNTHNEIFVFPESYYFVDGVELLDITDEDSIIIPNVITPNGDGTNDLFQLNFPVLRTEIYNRWGTKLFESN